MASSLEQFILDSQALVGRDAGDVSQGVAVADWLSIRRFCAALGDINPLYKDPSSGVATKYHSMIAPPTFIAAVRTPTSGAAYNQKQYALSLPNLTRFSARWVDVMRVGDRLASDLKVVSASEGPRSNGKPAAQVASQATYRNSYGGLIAQATGVTTLTPFAAGQEMLLDRPIYRYSAEEITRIERGIDSEVPPRGKRPRYWNEVSEGEKLPGLVKGPVTLNDQMAWTVAEGKPVKMGALVYADLKAMPGRVRTNPTTSWPFWDADQEYDDILSSKDMGLNGPPTRPMHRACLAAQVVTDWMSDDGFLRSLDVELPSYFIYGDTLWLTGEVTDKYKERIGAATYYAVDVRLRGVNQLGETIVRGTAAVYLPNPGSPVEIPIPA